MYKRQAYAISRNSDELHKRRAEALSREADERMMRLGEGAKVVALAVAQAEEELSQEEEGPEATREDE